MVDLIDCLNEPGYNKDYHYMFENDWYESPTQPWSQIVCQKREAFK